MTGDEFLFLVIRGVVVCIALILFICACAVAAAGHPVWAGILAVITGGLAYLHDLLGKWWSEGE